MLTSSSLSARDEPGAEAASPRTARDEFAEAIGEPGDANTMSAHPSTRNDEDDEP